MLKPHATERRQLLRITRADGSTLDVTLTLRVDTPIEVDYYRSGAFCPLCCGSCWRRE
jgi:aconitase A